MAKTKQYMQLYRARKKLQAQQAQQATAQTAAQQEVLLDTQQPTVTVTAGATRTLDDVQSMTPSEFATYLDGLNNAPNPMSAVLYDSATQRLIYDTGLNGKPTVVDDSQFRQLPGQTIYRTVNSVYDWSSDVNHPADQIVRQTMNSSLNRIGGGVYGDGFYFADSRSGSAAYGNTRGDVTRTAMMRAKLNSNARVVNYSVLSTQLSNEPRSLRRAVRSSGDMMAYAMYRGYNVITNGLGYTVVGDRSALTFSSRVTAI